MDNYLFEVIEAPLPRRKIENDLLARHRKLKQKIEALRVLRAKEDLKNNTSIPTINQKSRKIAKNISILSDSTRLSRTQSILTKSRFFPKQFTLSLESLTHSSNSFTFRSKPSIKYQFSSSTQRSPDPITFPSLDCLVPGFNSGIVKEEANQFLGNSIQTNPFNQPLQSSSGTSTQFYQEPSQVLPPDILKRNELLKSLRKETTTRGFKTEPDEPITSSPFALSKPDIHHRSKVWLQKKDEKLKVQRQQKDSTALVGCTFKPELISPRVIHTNSTLRTSPSEVSYIELYSKKLKSRSKCRAERNISQETKPYTAAHSTRISCNATTQVSPRYTSISPVPLNISELSGFKVISRLLNNKV